MALTTLDRTNRNNAFYQVRGATIAAFEKNEALLSISPDATYKAIVLFSEDKITIHQNSWARGLETQLEERLSIGRVIEKYKIYFRIPLLHAHLPLPPSFRNIVLPEGSPQIRGHKSPVSPQTRRPGENPNIVFSQTYAGDYCLKPEAEETLLISCHPSLWVSRDPSNVSSLPAHLDPGDVIEIKFSDGTFKSAEIVRVDSKGPNIVKAHDAFDWEGYLDEFEGETSILSDYETDDFGESPSSYYGSPDITATTTELLDALPYSGATLDGESVSVLQRKYADKIVELFSTAGFSLNIAMAAVVNAYEESRLDPQVCFGILPWGPNRLEGPKLSEENSCGLFQLNAAPGAAGAGMTPEQRKDPILNTQQIIRTVKGSEGSELRSQDAADAPLSELIYLFTRDIERPRNRESKGKDRAAMAESWWGEKIKVTGKNLTL